MITWRNSFRTPMHASLGLAIVVTLFASSPAQAQLRTGDFVCTYGAQYDVVWDGWSGKLNLYWYYPTGTLQAGGRTYSLRYQILANPQDSIEGRQGPGYVGTNSNAQHRIVFWVDFNNTPYYYGDDQRFDGYMMTQTRDAIAGTTWWNGFVFGFYARNKLCIPG